MKKKMWTGGLSSTSVIKKVKRILAVVMTVLMINSVIDYSGIVTTIAKAESTYDANGFGADGTSTIYQPAVQLTAGDCSTLAISSDYIGYYAIYNAGQLFWFASQVNSGNPAISARLMSEIDLSGKAWTPIGTYSDSSPENADNHPYTGTFDGGYHVISNLTVTEEGKYETGFFGRTQNAVIKNLGMKNASVTNNASIRAGILGGEIHLSTVTNCYTTGTVSTGNTQAGGIAGESFSSTLNNCVTTLGVLTNSGIANNCYAKTTETSTMFTSGELAYRLNGLTSEGSLVWGQTLSGTEIPKYPVFLNSDSSNKVYKISYQVGDTVAAVAYVNSSSNLLLKDDITVVGYEFNGWYQGDDTTTLLTAGSPATDFTADTVYHAALVKKDGWKKISYYTGNNGLEGLTDGDTLTGLSPSEYFPGYTYELPTPKLAGFKFLGWYTKADFSGEAIQSVSTGQEGDLTLYAKFELLTEWDGTTYNTSWSGAGTADDPYLVGSPDQLAGLAASVNAGESYSNTYFKVTKNLDMGDTWTPIGTDAHKFCGSFDGDLHTVTINISNTNSKTTGMALFGYLGAGAAVKNLGTTGNITTASQFAGGIAGLAQDGTIAITNCWSDVIIDYTTGGDATAGGIVGIINNNAAVTMTNCYFIGAIKSSGKSIAGVGGLCGWKADDSSLNAVNCYVAGTFGTTDFPVTGGENLSRNGGTFTNCYYLNKVYGDSTQGKQIASEMLASGEVCYLLSGEEVTDSTRVWYQNIDNNQTVDTYPKFSGGIVYKTATAYSNTKAKTTISQAVESIVKAYDGTAFELSTVKGTLFTWEGTGTATIDGYYTDSTGTTKTSISGSGAASEGAAPVNVGSYYAKVTIAANDNFLATTAYFYFQILPKDQINRLYNPGGELSSYDSSTNTTSYSLVNNGWSGATQGLSAHSVDDYSATINIQKQYYGSDPTSVLSIVPHSGYYYMGFATAIDSNKGSEPCSCYQDVDISEDATEIDNNTKMFNLSG